MLPTMNTDIDLTLVYLHIPGVENADANVSWLDQAELKGVGLETCQNKIFSCLKPYSKPYFPRNFKDLILLHAKNHEQGGKNRLLTAGKHIKEDIVALVKAQAKKDGLLESLDDKDLEFLDHIEFHNEVHNKAKKIIELAKQEQPDITDEQITLTNTLLDDNEQQIYAANEADIPWVLADGFITEQNKQYVTDSNPAGLYVTENEDSTMVKNLIRLRDEMIKRQAKIQVVDLAKPSSPNSCDSVQSYTNPAEASPAKLAAAVSDRVTRSEKRKLEEKANQVNPQNDERDAAKRPRR